MFQLSGMVILSWWLVRWIRILETPPRIETEVRSTFKTYSIHILLLSIFVTQIPILIIGWIKAQHSFHFYPRHTHCTGHTDCRLNLKLKVIEFKMKTYFCTINCLLVRIYQFEVMWAHGVFACIIIRLSALDQTKATIY